MFIFIVRRDSAFAGPSLRKPSAKEGAPTGGFVDLLALLEGESEGGGHLRCRACGHVITSVAARIQVGGAHRHERMNPAGFVYLIGCFGAAPGCVAVGEASLHFTWFPGCAWRVVICGACFEHLGWSFAKQQSSFFGLILERLVSDEQRSADG